MSDRSVWWLIGVGAALRVAWTVINSIAGPLPGADADAINFHRFAAGVAEGEVREGAPLTFAFAFGVGLLYRLVGPFQLVGGLVSCAVWVLAAWALGRVLVAVGLARRYQSAVMLIFSLWPSAVVWTSVILREPYQLLCVNLIMLALVGLSQQNRLRDWVLLVSATLIGALLHAVVMVGGVVAIVLMVFAGAGRRAGQSAWQRGSIAIVAASATAAAVVMTYSSYMGDGLLQAMGVYARSAAQFQARTSYLNPIDAVVDGGATFLAYIGKATGQYFLAPWPWHVVTWLDAGLLVENVARATLIAAAVAAVVIHRQIQRRLAILLLILFFALETLWAVGTFNWGTAARHHVPALGVLLAAASLYLVPPMGEEA